MRTYLKVTDPFQKGRHLNEDQLFFEESSCPICKNEKRVRIMLLQAEPDVWLLKCSQCHICSASRMPTDDALEACYSQYYEKESQEKVTIDRPLRLSRHIFQEVAKRSKNKQWKIIDYGGGDGTVSMLLGHLLLAHGSERVRIIVVDLNSSPQQTGDHRLVVETHTSFDRLPRNNQDIVIASGVLEHIRSPSSLIKDLFFAMKPGGLFYARTPYNLPLMRLCKHFNVEYDFTYPAHVHDMGQFFWDNVLSTFGMGDQFRSVLSRPSIVETTLRQNFVRTIAAYVLKAPWFIVGKQYGFVGGWEVFIKREVKNNFHKLS